MTVGPPLYFRHLLKYGMKCYWQKNPHMTLDALKGLIVQTV